MEDVVAGTDTTGTGASRRGGHGLNPDRFMMSTIDQMPSAPLSAPGSVRWIARPWRIALLLLPPAP
jgi:hypothetical protein